MHFSKHRPFRSLCFLAVTLSLSLLLLAQANRNAFADANEHVLLKDRRQSVFDQPRHRHGFQSLDSVFVINLESRKDRLQQITHVLSQLGLGGTRHKVVNGIPHSCGILGCGLSHALALIGCIDSNATVCAVFEDDFELVRDPEEANAALERFFRGEPPSWEVLMLSANQVTPNTPSPDFGHLDVINQALTASGYLVHRSFAPTLLRTFMQAAFHLNKSNCSQAHYAHDVLWTSLQRSGKWFALKPLVGKQRASYSDIEKMDVDYRVRR